MKAVYFELLFLVVISNAHFGESWGTPCYKADVMDCVRDYEGVPCALGDPGFARDCVRCQCNPLGRFRCNNICYPSGLGVGQETLGPVVSASIAFDICIPGQKFIKEKCVECICEPTGRKSLSFDCHRRLFCSDLIFE